VGESWEVASLPEGKSTIANGLYKSKSLDEMISAFAKAILETSTLARFGPEMPLLTKFIDASKKLSVQLHPDNTIAQELHQHARGKTEMWYILKAKKDAYIIAGFKDTMNVQQFRAAIADNSLEEKLNVIPVKEGDAFYISAGLIHAIGEGIVLAEIQQTSDITYRVHDYNRKQEDGSYRDLHIDNACKAIKFDTKEEISLPYTPEQKGVQELKHSPFFKTDIVNLINSTHGIDRDESFTILIAVAGQGIISCNGADYIIKVGDTYLLPAQCPEVKVKSQELKFLEVYM
jgi:mannose-6-phosphate isomerase